jgi:hypothetical protein
VIRSILAVAAAVAGAIGVAANRRRRRERALLEVEPDVLLPFSPEPPLEVPGVAVAPAPAAEPPPVAAAQPRRRRSRTLHGVNDIRRFFRTTRIPVYFVSATAFNLLGIERWMPAFRYVNYYDSFDGEHPAIFVPPERSPRAFESIEEICNYLLGHKGTLDLVGDRGGLATFLMFDEETEDLAHHAGLEVAFPGAVLRHRLDSKIETTRLADEAGVPSVPNVIGQAATYEQLRTLADGASLGPELVVQTAYGDSGKTTYFIADEREWREHADDIRGQAVKVMRRIEPRETAIEAVVTRHGTIVGPLMTELTGFPELTPYIGGWCGDEVFGEPLPSSLRVLARRHAAAMGERLRSEGYRGYFELDFLADTSSGELYLGELNPRVTGASPMTNVSALAYEDLPLFLFHVLEWMGVEYELDVEELNERWAEPDNVDAWAQLVMKDTDDHVELITKAPRSGVWRMVADGRLEFARRATDWHGLTDESEAFYLRIAEAGGYRYHGADIGILVTRGRLMTDDHELTDRARAWIAGLRAQFASIPVDVPPVAIPRPDPFGFKML